MARYTGPNCKLCRREGMKLFLKGARCQMDKCSFDRRSMRPACHWSKGGMSSAKNNAKRRFLFICSMPPNIFAVKKIQFFIIKKKAYLRRVGKISFSVLFKKPASQKGGDPV